MCGEWTAEYAKKGLRDAAGAVSASRMNATVTFPMSDGA